MPDYKVATEGGCSHPTKACTDTAFTSRSHEAEYVHSSQAWQELP